MATHDNHEPFPNENRNALVERGAVQGGPPMAMSSPFGGPGANQGVDVLKGGMDKSWLYNSLRRRWLLALSMSLLVGTLGAVGLYFILPASYVAIAQYQVMSDPLNVLDTKSALQTRDFDIYKNTQLAYIRSPFVLTAVFREDPEIARLAIFEDVENKIDWLRDNLQVAFPNDGELLTISLSGDYDKEDLKKVVDAVSEAYFEEVVYRERGQRQKPLQILRQSFAKLEDQIRNKMIAYQELAKDSGTSQAYTDGIDPQTRLMMSEVDQILRRKTKVEEQIAAIDAEYRVFEQQINDPSYQERLIDEAMQGDPNMAQMQNEMMSVQFQIRQLQSTAKNGTSSSVRRLERQYQMLNQQYSQAREQMRQQIAGQQANEPNALLKAQSTAYQIQRGMLAREVDTLDQRLTELQELLLEKAEVNTDLVIRSAEIDQLRHVQQEMANKMQNMQVELEAPERIQGIGATEENSPAPAETEENLNRVTRLALGGLGGLGLFLLTGFGIAYLEFTNRKLNGPEQMDEGLGIRVVGTLPSLSGARELNPNHPIVAQLNESIDGVRTALMHESTRKRRQIVLVTSAETSEGRTTVASQLAASLARAGRRTLLVDGDLRRPALHSLFNLPLEDGLCEVLRAESELSDVIRPTQAKGLWLMTAGYCDSEAVKSLATDQVEPIFEKLRGDYDFIIIDGAPVLGLSDSLMFGQHADGAILSVLRDVSCVTKIHQASELLRSIGVKLIGSVVNGMPSKADSRVTHLQQVAPKSEQRQLETTEV